ncbi:hypothetical protein [Dactylosporangium sp. CA-139066]|uniref:hypothetical protein n=1 Tax=Dactylosporangium sp. CA-139066 TaxID=3239930 RepID=UPI003D8B29EC
MASPVVRTSGCGANTRVTPDTPGPTPFPADQESLNELLNRIGDGGQQHAVPDKVAVWTAERLAAFRDRVAGNRLWPCGGSLLLRSLRPGEAIGLRWFDIDLQRGTATITQQITCARRRVLIGRRRAASRRVIALDRHGPGRSRAPRSKQRATTVHTGQTDRPRSAGQTVGRQRLEPEPAV